MMMHISISVLPSTFSNDIGGVAGGRRVGADGRERIRCNNRKKKKRGGGGEGGGRRALPGLNPLLHLQQSKVTTTPLAYNHQTWNIGKLLTYVCT